MKEMCIAVLVFILLDIVSGVLAAAKDGELKSTIMRQGLYHKCGELMLLGLAIAGQWIITVNGFETVIPPEVLSSVAVYIVVMELVSILENIGKLNPEFDLNAISKLFGKGDEQ